MKIIRYLLSLSLSLVIGGCTSVTTLPPTGEMRTVIANASKENDAVKLASDRAQNICVMQNQKLKIIDLDTTYEGMDASQKALDNLARKVLPNDKTNAAYDQSGYTYKATLTFKCI